MGAAELICFTTSFFVLNVDTLIMTKDWGLICGQLGANAHPDDWPPAIRLISG